MSRVAFSSCQNLYYLHVYWQLTYGVCMSAGKIYRWERRFRSCPAVVTMCIILRAWCHGSRSITRALCVGSSCQQMTWRTKTRKSETRVRQKTGRVLPMLCLILTFCIPNGRDVSNLQHAMISNWQNLSYRICCGQQFWNEFGPITRKWSSEVCSGMMLACVKKQAISK